jgi:hypothetical protein
MLGVAPESKGKPNEEPVAEVCIPLLSHASSCNLRWRSGSGSGSLSEELQDLAWFRRPGLSGHGESVQGPLQDLSSKEVQTRTDVQMAKDIAGGTGQKKAIKP